MIQNIIVGVIVAGALVYTLLAVYRPLRPGTKSAGSCGGCTGCELKNMKNSCGQHPEKPANGINNQVFKQVI